MSSQVRQPSSDTAETDEEVRPIRKSEATSNAVKEVGFEAFNTRLPYSGIQPLLTQAVTKNNEFWIAIQGINARCFLIIPTILNINGYKRPVQFIGSQV